MQEKQRSGADLIEKRERARRRSVIAERVWFGVLSAALVVVILIAVIVGAASRQPTTCGWCHTTVVKTTSHTAHSNLRCDQCHAGTSGFTLAESRFSTVGMVVNQWLPGKSSQGALVDSDACLVCHQSDMDKTVTVNGIKMNHHAVNQAGWSCQQCHPGVGHAYVSSSAGYNMDMCLGCHASSSANIGSCNTCHTNQNGTTSQTVGNRATPWQVTHGSGWRKTHGMGDLATCKACHQPNFCDQCHVANVPHPSTYISMHGADVLSRDNGRTACLVCHQPSACDNCHGLPMPHPPNFIKGHSALAKTKGTPACLKCHVQSSCTDCHARHTHPGLDANTIKTLRSHPVANPVGTP